MRIITGKYKGQRLKSAAKNEIRPLMDRVKKYIFDVLQDEIHDSIVLDLFAGTGSFGIEAASQGANQVIFIDKYPRAIQSIEKNIAHIQMKEYHSVIQKDAKRFVVQCKQKFDLIFCDAPYDYGELNKLIGEIAKRELLNNHGVLIIEHYSRILLDDYFFKYYKERNKKFGKTIVTMYRKHHE